MWSDVPMSSTRRRYWPAAMQSGMVKETLPLLAIRRSTPHLPLLSRPSSQI